MSGGCFSPRLETGLPCSESGRCPDGELCHPDNLCRPDLTPPDNIDCGEDGLIVVPLDGMTTQPSGDVPLGVAHDAGGVGPGRCDSARRFISGEYIELSHNPALQVADLSVELYAWLPRNSDGTEQVLGLLSKDQVGDSTGDFVLVALYEPMSERPNLVARIQTATADGVVESDYFVCSTLAPVEDWVHVRVDIGAEPMTLRLNGSSAERQSPIAEQAGLGSTVIPCGETDLRNTRQGWLNNSNAMVIGGGNHTATITLHLAGGAIDHVRIRTPRLPPL